MDHQQPINQPGKASGLPKPSSSKLPTTSKLPALRTRASHVQLPKQEEARDPPEQSQPTSRLQKRSSIATLPKPSGLPPPKPTGLVKSNATRNATVNGPGHVAKGSISTRPGTVQPSSRGNQQKIPQPLTKARPRPGAEDSKDELGSLNRFRSVSGQSSKQDIEAESPVDSSDADLPSPSGRKSRPSLSDRTVGSLSNVAGTPKEKRQSDFFSPIKSPMGPPARPASSMSRNDDPLASPFGRPHSPAKRTVSSAKPSTRTSIGGFGFGFGGGGAKRSASTSLTARLQESRDAARPASPAKTHPSVDEVQTKEAQPVAESKTMAARPPQSRPALADAFEQPDQVAEETAEKPKPKAPKPRKPPPTTTAKVEPDSAPANNSSSALRQQIAAAKAAARKEKAKNDDLEPEHAQAGDPSNIDTHADPFNAVPRDEKHVMRNRINAARMDSKLNIAALGLKDIPKEVMEMYGAKAMEDSKVSWAEVVDLIRLNAADNQIERIGDSVFPDRSMEEIAADEDSEGNQFGGLESIDLHGNCLKSLPLGLRRLERLTTLNLSHNNLDNSCFDLISQIGSLKDLKLGHNALTGNLPASLCQLKNLEVLDLKANRIVGLPDALRDLKNLRTLDVSSNNLTEIRMDALRELPLVELDASSNALMGSLFPLGGESAHATLRDLRVANNSLATLTFSEVLDLPQLNLLDVTNNHLTVLPSVAGWTELITLTAGDNRMSDFPPGIIMLKKLRNFNFSNNEMRLLDPEIARIESLESLILSSNPLRERKFLTMNTQDIKRNLMARLEVDEDDDDDGVQDQPNGEAVANAISSKPAGTNIWRLSANGTLDLASRGLTNEVVDELAEFVQKNDVKHINLQSNKLTTIPSCLSLAQDLRTLDFSVNSLAATPLSGPLLLPNLRELNLARCNLIELDTLTAQIEAPQLETLNTTANRLSGPVPTLRQHYPNLRTFFAGDCKFNTVTPEAIHGLHAVNLSNNALEQLPAEIGLLWDHGLRSLEAGGNVFRVPGYRVLEKGTEAVCRWLRDRIPAASDAVE